MEKDRPRFVEEEKLKQEVSLGLGIIIENEENEVLMGLRTSASGKGLLAIPGGVVDLDDNGDLGRTAIRETLEESGLDISHNKIDIISVDTSEVVKKGWLNFGLHTRVLGRPETIAQNGEYFAWAWVRRSTVKVLINKPGVVFEPSRISLLSFYRREILYPFKGAKEEN